MSAELLKQNYFDVFSVPVAVDVDLEKVDQLYHDYQKQFHPDRFASAGDQERRISVQLTSHVNQAYRTLKDPLLRAEYLLQLAGVEDNPETRTTMDGAFLMQQMELRERIESIPSQSDPFAEIDALNKQLKATQKDLLQAFADDYVAGNYPPALEIISKLKFLRKSLEEIDDISEKLENEFL